MRALLLGSFLASFVFVASHAHAQPVERWSATWNNPLTNDQDTLSHRDPMPRHSSRRALAVGDEVMVVGLSVGDNPDGFMARWDLDGGMVHQSVVPGPTFVDYFTAVTFDPDGNSYVVGTMWGPTAALGCMYEAAEGVAMVFKYSPTGEIQWCRGFEGTGTEHEIAWQVQYAMGRVYVGAETSETGTGQDLAVVNFDATTGEEQWRRNFGTDNVDRMNDMAVDPDTGDVWVVGHGNDGTGMAWVVGRMTADGMLAFGQTYRGTGTGENIPTAIVPDGEGGAVVAGWMHNTGTSIDATLMRLSSLGAETWRRSHDGTATNVDRLHALQRQGGVLVAAGMASNAMGRAQDALLLRYDLDGNELCTGLFDHRAEAAFDVALDADGNAYVAGHSFSDSTFGEDWLVASFDDACEVRWSVRRDGGDEERDIAYAIRVLDDGDVIVAGNTWEGGAESNVVVVRLGQPCTDDAECDDGLACTDDACVDAACTNEPTAAGTVCRESTGACDPGETCDGTSSECPSDLLAEAGTECRAAADVCDVAESCDGSAADCPADAFAGAGTECRSSTGVCDVSESCDGASAACPSDAFADGTVCGDDMCGEPLMCMDGVCPPSDCDPMDAGGTGGCSGCATSDARGAWPVLLLLLAAKRRKRNLSR